jgi:hypothetical protein
MVFFLCIPCLAIFIYLAIAGIFFPRYRVYLQEAWRCFVDKLMGKKCSVSFDNKARLAISAWFAKRNMNKTAKFLYNKRNFNIAMISFFIIFTIVTTWLFFLFIKFLINSPCAGKDTCTIPVGN